MKDIEYYETPSGKKPAREWLFGLTEDIQGRILRRIDKLAQGGGKKNIKPLGGGVFELKIDMGPGFRLYFGEKGRSLIILLLGGDKSTQKRDIEKAKDYWRQYGQSY